MTNLLLMIMVIPPAFYQAVKAAYIDANKLEQPMYCQQENASLRACESVTGRGIVESRRDMPKIPLG